MDTAITNDQIRDHESPDEVCTELFTERLFLRTLTEADVDVVISLYGDEFQTEEAALEHIRWITHNAFEGRLVVNFYLWIRETNQCIGRVYIHSKPELNHEVEIGYGISEAHRNHGYTTEAAKEVVRFAFEKLGLDVLVAIVKPSNHASRRVIEKLGFTKNGIRMVLDENGEECAFDYFQLHRDDNQSRPEQVRTLQ